MDALQEDKVYKAKWQAALHGRKTNGLQAYQRQFLPGAKELKDDHELKELIEKRTKETAEEIKERIKGMKKWEPKMHR